MKKFVLVPIDRYERLLRDSIQHDSNTKLLKNSIQHHSLDVINENVASIPKVSDIPTTDKITTENLNSTTTDSHTTYTVKLVPPPGELDDSSFIL